MLRGKHFFKKSKKGFTLVETLCAIFVLAIVFVGILNAVAFSRQMVFTNNAREKASYEGQLIADEILSAATGFNPETDDPTDAIEGVINNVENDPQNVKEGKTIAPGTKIVNKVTTLTDPKNFKPTGDCHMEYTISKVTESYSDGMEDVPKDPAGGADTVSMQEAHETGWDIVVRVFYQEIGNQGDYLCVDITAFAPYNYIGN